MTRRTTGLRTASLLLAASPLLAQLALADEDIRDLRGPKSALAGRPLALIAVTALALAVAAYLLWRRLRRAPAAPPATAAQTALAGLEAARALLAAPRAREFCDAVSDVVRHYLEAQFALSAPRSTTEEFLQQLSALPASPVAAHQASLAQFLQHCDFVRFSGTSADTASLEALYQSARSFVIDTANAPHDPVPAT